jgi:large conductance mechanosensitive channel
VFAYGNFLTISINFLILAFIIFMLVRWINKMKRADAVAPAEPPEEVKLLREIRDSLKLR